MKYNQTERGFSHIDFMDRYGEECSIQKSSLATENAIWFGIDAVKPVMHQGQAHYMGRMHLTQEQVKELLPILQYFAEHGELPAEGA